MSSTFIPTFLYIKQHTVTGMLYLGKTTQNPETYIGSGKRWRNHIKKHGINHIINLWYCLFIDQHTLSELAISLSNMYDIVVSESWANLIIEDGIGGGNTFSQLSIEGQTLFREKSGKQSRGRIRPQDERDRISLGNSRPKTELEKLHMSEAKQDPKYKDIAKNNLPKNMNGENNGMFNRKHSEESLQRMRDRLKLRHIIKVTCLHCHKVFRHNNFSRHIKCLDKKYLKTE